MELIQSCGSRRCSVVSKKVMPVLCEDIGGEE